MLPSLDNKDLLLLPLLLHGTHLTFSTRCDAMRCCTDGGMRDDTHNVEAIRMLNHGISRYYLSGDLSQDVSA